MFRKADRELLALIRDTQLGGARLNQVSGVEERLTKRLKDLEAGMNLMLQSRTELRKGLEMSASHGDLMDLQILVKNGLNPILNRLDVISGRVERLYDPMGPLHYNFGLLANQLNRITAKIESKPKKKTPKKKR